VKRIDVVKQGDEWVGKQGPAVVARADTKEAAVKAVARVAKADPVPVSVKSHKADGKFQEERTYPRSADPRGSKG
jgi:hypothetical protein